MTFYSVPLTAKHTSHSSASGSVLNGLEPLNSQGQEHRQAGVFGVRPGQATWSLDEVRDFVIAGNVDNLNAFTKLRFTGYTRLERLEEEMAEDESILVCSLPPGALVRALLVGEMREMCKRHNIQANRADVKASLREKLIEHECSPGCGQHVTLFTPIDDSGPGDGQGKPIAKAFTLGDIREWVDDEEVLKRSGQDSTHIGQAHEAGGSRSEGFH
ncbi:hypothetical protein CC1G_13026 [Coprinopsis cinerea okayama7|uniref:Uncharacterized protein n=1 Tax=Coprinopsis cinerea (strain Okayama-7 / 130 / ATCC MYA-4618 / FGSC 9003) TaxID=240176 RepID=A8PGU5_COPC7|nr:hypothetical protein CC1G_13026 [Coprinopsis cinerea okayama7\|eukprot:XP_001841283.2 hypothetical protein CC1G_13026 [Coprinopsis cinerea okayama7\